MAPSPTAHRRHTRDTDIKSLSAKESPQNGPTTEPKILTKLSKIRRQVADWLTPQSCEVCQQVHSETLICQACYPSLPFQAGCCDRCGQNYAATDAYCGRCIESPPHFDRCVSVFRYEAPISDQIQRLKYGDWPSLAHKLAQLMARELIANNITKPQLLVPVPMHHQRLYTRGFNQAALLCRHLAKELKIEHQLGLIRKTRSTAPQVDLTLKQRKSNLRGAFTVTRPTVNSDIAIIDDVLTTGSTANEIAKLLKRKGATNVQVWTLAHTL